MCMKISVKDLIKQEAEELGLTLDEKKFLNLKHSKREHVNWSILKTRRTKRKDNGKKRR